MTKSQRRAAKNCDAVDRDVGSVEFQKLRQKSQLLGAMKAAILKARTVASGPSPATKEKR